MAVVFIVGAMFALALILYLYRQFRMKRHGITTEAEVIGIRVTERSIAEDFDHTEIRVRFRDMAGAEHEARLSSVPAVRVGQKITIRYDPANMSLADYVHGD